jgi:hypothetical protein
VYSLDHEGSRGRPATTMPFATLELGDASIQVDGIC